MERGSLLRAIHEVETCSTILGELRPRLLFILDRRTLNERDACFCACVTLGHRADWTPYEFSFSPFHNRLH